MQQERRKTPQSGGMRVVERVEDALREALSEQGLRVAYRVGHATLRPYWWLARPRVTGTKVVVRHGDRVLLLKHSYARRRQWDLPGGFVGLDERAADAVCRELQEELGIDEPRGLRCISREQGRNERKRETLLTFTCEIGDPDVLSPSRAEIDEARWFDAHALPPAATPFVRRMVARSEWPRERIEVLTR